MIDQATRMSVGHPESFQIRAEAISRIWPSLRYSTIGSPEQPDAIELPQPFVGYSERQQLLRFLADLDINLGKFVDSDQSSFSRDATAELLAATERLVRFYREYGELYAVER